MIFKSLEQIRMSTPKARGGTPGFHYSGQENVRFPNVP